MAQNPRGSIESHFSGLEDPRIERQKLHKLLDIIIIAICGVICGADNWVDIEMFGNKKIEWLRQFLELPNGILSHDTFGRVFGLLDAQQFQVCFMEWARAVKQITSGQVIAMDGKQMRGSHDGTTGRMPYIWLVPGQLKIRSCWDSAKWMINPMKSRPYRNY